MARVITAVGEWEPPALVGLCEVENDTVLRDLTRRSPLKELNYRYVMTDSPDLRGIDVALLYQRDLFKLLSFRSVSIPPLKQVSPHERFVARQWFATDRRHTGLYLSATCQVVPAEQKNPNRTAFMQPEYCTQRLTVFSTYGFIHKLSLWEISMTIRPINLFRKYWKQNLLRQLLLLL